MYQLGGDIILYQRDRIQDMDEPTSDTEEKFVNILLKWAKENKGLIPRVRASLEYEGEFHEIDANIIGIDTFRNIIFDINPFDNPNIIYYQYHVNHEENKVIDFKYMPEASENRSLMNIDLDYDTVWTIYYPAGDSGFNKVFKGQLEII